MSDANSSVSGDRRGLRDKAKRVCDTLKELNGGNEHGHSEMCHDCDVIETALWWAFIGAAAHQREAIAEGLRPLLAVQGMVVPVLNAECVETAWVREIVEAALRRRSTPGAEP